MPSIAFALGATATAQPLNPGFDEDLSGWTVGQRGGTTGSVTWDAGTALLVEGDGLLVVLEQTFVLPVRADVLSFALTAGPDRSARFLPDAIEVHLVDAVGRSLVPTWKPGATSFLNVQEDGTVHTAPGAAWGGGIASVDVSSLVGPVRLVVALVGGDDDEGSWARVDDVVVMSRNLPPVADAGPDATVECGAGGTTLDASASLDPDGDPIAFAWTDEGDAVLGTAASLPFDGPVGVATVTLAVTDALGASSVDTVDVTVEDTTPPVAPVVLAVEVEADAACAGTVPDLTGEISPVDTCSEVTVTQDVAAGTPLVLDTPTDVRLTSADASGNGAVTTVTVTLVDTDGSCAGEPPDPPGDLLCDPSDDPPDKVTICHLPPGNPANAQTLVVGAPAVAAHVRQHGDTVGPCATCEEPGPPTDTGDTGQTGDTGAVPPGNSGKGGKKPRRRPRPRRRGRAALLLAGLLAASAPARADDVAVAIGDLVAGQISTPDEVDTLSFAAAPGQRVYLQQVATTNPWNLSWSLSDVHGRDILSRDDLQDLGAATLMGGVYEVTVRGTGASTGPYVLRVADAPIRDLGPVALDTDVSGTIAAPGERHRYTLVAAAGQRVLLEAVATTNLFGLEWQLVDPVGRVLRSSTRLDDLGFQALAGGDYTIEVGSRSGGTGEYTIRASDAVGSASVVAIGATVSGTAGSALERFTFAAAGGERLFLDVLTAPDDGALLRLLDPHGQVVASTSRLQDLGPVDLVAGDWTLEVAPTGANLLPDYQLDLVAVTDLAGTLTIGTPEVAPFAQPGQVARYTFTAADGRRAFFRSLAAAPEACGWSLLHADGRVVQALTDDLGFAGPYFLDGGDYTLTLDPEGDAAGPVPFVVLDPVDTSTAAALGDTVTATLADPGSTHTVTFTATAGQLLTIDVTSGMAFDLGYELVDAAGRAVVPYTGDLRDTAEVALAGGSYALVFRGEGGATGSPTVDLVDAGATSFVPTGTAASLDTDVVGSGPQSWTFDVPSDGPYFLDLVSGGPDRWELLDPAGRSVFSSVPAHEDEDPFALVAGTYTLEVSNVFRPMDYVFRVGTVPPPVTEPIATGDVLDAAFTVPGETHTYAFALAAAADVFLDLQLGHPMLRWSLADEHGQPVIPLGDAADSLRLRLGAGTYFLVVDPLYDAVPAYAFALHEVVDEARAVAIGDSVATAFATPGARLVATFDAVDGDEVVLDVTDPTVRARWTLLDPAGTSRFADTAFWDQGPFTLTAGPWTVEVEAAGDDVPLFAFDLVRPDDVVGGAFALDDLVSVDPAGPGTLEWTLVLADPADVYVDVVAASLARLSIFDPAGEPVLADAPMVSDAGRYALDRGTYRVEVRVSGSSPPPVAFTFVGVDDTVEDVASGQVVDDRLAEPGQRRTYRFDVPTDGLEVMVDLLKMGPGVLAWTLVDPVGQPVAPLREAYDDLLAVPLASGVYEVTVSSAFLPDYSFVVLEEAGGPSFDYTRFAGETKLKRAFYAYDGVTFRKTFERPLAELPEADGLVVAPDGDLVVGGGARVYKVDPDTGAVVSVPSGGNAKHLALDPSGTKVWAGGVPGELLEIPLVPFSAGVARALSGPDTVLTHVAFDRTGRAFYTASGPGGHGSFGLLDLTTFTTTRIYDDLPAAHGMGFDPLTDTLVLTGHGEVAQIDAGTLAVVSTLTSPVGQLDQGTPDGQGHAFAASNSGELLFVDYAATGLVGDPSNFVGTAFVDLFLDDVAPLSWLGSDCGGPPMLAALSPADASVLVPGTVVVVSGRVPAVDPTRPVTAILVDGLPPASVDAAGNFYALNTVVAGENAISLQWFDRCGSGSSVLTLYGDEHPEGRPSLADSVTSLLSSRFTDTTWDLEGLRLLARVAAENTSDTPVVGPVFMAVGPDLDPVVQLANADGVTAEGLPYVDALGAGLTLGAGESTPAADLVFHDPEEHKVRFTPLWLATGNHPPTFSSIPVTGAVADRPWAYEARAVDPDGHVLTFSLAAGPVAVSSTGEASWTPTLADVGTHEVRIRVEDGFGGSAEQAFVLSVEAVAPNVPPIFATAPPTTLAVSTPLVYDALALDADGDPVAYALLAGPAGMTADAVTGVVSWPGDVAGAYEVSLEATDGRGGVAVQSWTLTVGDGLPAGSGPLVTSTPPLVASVSNLYLYQPVATDAQGDALSWSLGVAPVGMTADAVTGRVLWTPRAEDVGVVAVTLVVSDGTASVEQAWQLSVSTAPANRAPVFSTVAPPTAVLGALYVYDADAIDPEAGAVTFALDAGPAGAAIHAATGVVSFMPATVGVATVAIRASDALGASATQVSYVQVRGANAAPVVTSGPPLATVVGAPFEHRVTASDADGDLLTFTLAAGPAGLALDPATGVVAWVPTLADAGLHPVRVDVRDPFGGLVSDAWDLEVLTEDGPPSVVLELTSPVCANEPVVVCVSASDDVSVVRTTLSADGVDQPLDPVGCAVLTPSAAVALDATATDGSGNLSADTGTLSVEDCSGPVVTLASPVDGDRLGVPADVLATATSAAAIDAWTLFLGDAVVAGGSGDVPGTALFQLDPTLRENGLYTVRLEVTDVAGRTGAGEAAVVVDGAMKLGSYDLAFLDAEWSVPPATISLVRSYSTTRKDAVGDFGNGWRLSMLDVVVETNGALGDGGWSQTQCGGGFLFVPVCFETTKPHLVVVKWPGGRVDAFDFTPPPTSSFFALVGEPGYTARPGTFSTLEAVPEDATLTAPGTGDLTTDLAFTRLYDPQRFVLTDPDGTRWLLEKGTGVLEMTDPLGNVTRFTPAGIFPDVGPGVDFVRDAAGRIMTMVLPDDSEIAYVYDLAGDLVEVVDGEGNVLEFAYDAGHRLTSYNVRGEGPIAEVVYDAGGRVQSVTDGSGVLLGESSDLTGYEQVTVGPDAGLTTTTRFDGNGLVSEVVQEFVDASGAQQRFVTATTYDDDFLMATRTLPTGAVEAWLYDDEGRVTIHTDAAGVVREWVYGPLGQVAEHREGAEIVERTEFGPDDLPAVAYRGDGTVLRRTTWDAVGRPLTLENGTGQVVSFAYDAAGNLDTLTLPDFDGAPDVVDVTVDGRGQLLAVTREYPTGPGTTSFGYDANGNSTSITDPLGHVMSFTFDALGRRLTYTDKLGHAPVVWTYDASGRELTKTNRNGDALTSTYDIAGRLATFTGPGVDKEFAYDALGRTVSARSGVHVEERVYDGPFLVQVTIDGVLDHTWDVTFDAADRLVQLDGESQSVTYGYDDRDRVATVTEASLGTFTFAYDAAGRPSTLTRPNGAVTATQYDASGRTSGTITEDALGALVHQVLTTYDDRGLPEAQTDPEGTHDYEHDVVGRLVGVDHPPGAGFADEAYTYDAADRRTSTSSSDDLAVEVVYDDGDRLLQDADYTYTYDDEGRRIGRTHRVTGEVTTYGYNALDQLTTLTESGVTWEFAYDANDLRVLVRNDAGYGEAFVYDLNGAVRATYDLTGARTAAYVTGFGFGEVLARMVGTGQPESTLRDRLGTTVGWLDPDGQVAETTVRDAYGQRLTDPLTVVPFGYTGHAEDPAGLVWGRARCYAPSTGGWTSEDPVPLQPRYAYVTGFVTIAVDPTGRADAIDYATVAVLGCATAFVAGEWVQALFIDIGKWRSGAAMGASCAVGAAGPVLGVAGVGGVGPFGAVVRSLLTGTATVGGGLLGSLLD